MSKPLVQARLRAFQQQDGHCFYCGVAMVDGDPKAIAARLKKSIRQLQQLQCTAEHLQPRKDGGGGGENIVAACRYCNHSRHKHASLASLSWELYRARVQDRVARKKWHCIRMYGLSRLIEGLRCAQSKLG